MTPTQRLARRLRGDFAQQQIQAGRQVWPSADTLTWQAWCQRCWERVVICLANPPLLLNTAQQQRLWLQLVQQSPLASQLISVNNTALQAMQSYQVCRQWQIPVFPDDVYLNEDAYQFRRWVAEYERLIKEHHWLDDARLPDQLGDSFSDGTFPAPDRVQFYGFDQWTPQQQSLFDKLLAAGRSVGRVQATRAQASQTVCFAENTAHEFEQAAAWCRQNLAQEPGKRVGVVITDLAQSREQVEAIFSRQLAPESLVENNLRSLPFQIAPGKPLSRFPLVEAALSLLSALQHTLDIESLTALFGNGFVAGSSKEFHARALCYARLRETGEHEFSLPRLIYLLDEVFTGYECPELVAILQHLQRLRSIASQRLQPGEWVAQFNDCLKECGWASEFKLDSEQYQTLQAWQDCLDQMRSLDVVMHRIDLSSAISTLKQLVTGSNFQPETEEAPVQILGPDAVAAMSLDKVWICGVDDQHWPPAAQPYPFIPVSLQKQKQIPAASAESQRLYSQQLLNTLMTAASEVVVSVPRFDKDRPLRPSPFLADVQPAVAGQFESKPHGYSTMLNQHAMQTFAERSGPALDLTGAFNGTSALFRDQALCPFRAFANHRLQANSIASVDIGLSASDRGRLVHRALQMIWQRLKTQKQLKTSSETVLADYITRAVDATLQFQAERMPTTFTDRFRQLEQQRLIRLVRDSLVIDLDRPPFTVAGTEKGHHVAFAGITLSMRLDRIDQLNDGRLVIIDYKTGVVSPGDWEDERPSDPQLPLYAVTSDGEVAALVFARIKSGDVGYHGLAQEDGILAGKVITQPDWQEKLVEWRQVLTNLAEEFKQGLAEVAPKDDSACRYCDLHAFCRIHEKCQNGSGEVVDE